MDDLDRVTGKIYRNMSVPEYRVVPVGDGITDVTIDQLSRSRELRNNLFAQFAAQLCSFESHELYMTMNIFARNNWIQMRLQNDAMFTAKVNALVAATLNTLGNTNYERS